MTQLRPLARMVDRAMGIRAVVMTTWSGEVLDSAGEKPEKLEPLASFASGMLEIGSRLGLDAQAGYPESMTIRTQEGVIFVHVLSDERLLLTLATQAMPVGSLRQEVRWCVERLGALAF